jgi:hypothetical protein
VLPLLLVLKLYVPLSPVFKLGAGIAVALLGTLLGVVMFREGRHLLHNILGLVVRAVKKEVAA